MFANFLSSPAIVFVPSLGLIFFFYFFLGKAVVQVKEWWDFGLTLPSVPGRGVVVERDSPAWLGPLFTDDEDDDGGGGKHSPAAADRLFGFLHSLSDHVMIRLSLE